MIFGIFGADGSTIVNVIVAEQEFVVDVYPGAVRIDNVSPVPGIGWRLSNGEFYPPAS